MTYFRNLDLELAKILSGSEYGDTGVDGFRNLNWLSILINEKVISNENYRASETHYDQLKLVKRILCLLTLAS